MFLYSWIYEGSDSIYDLKISPSFRNILQKNLLEKNQLTMLLFYLFLFYCNTQLSREKELKNTKIKELQTQIFT